MEEIIGLREFRENVEKYARDVQKGGTLLVVRRSKPLFRLAPPQEELWEEVIDFTKMI